MLLHNPHRHNIHCHGLGEDLHPFETRELTDEQATLIACPDCRCQVLEGAEPEPAKRDTKHAAK